MLTMCVMRSPRRGLSSVLAPMRMSWPPSMGQSGSRLKMDHTRFTEASVYSPLNSEGFSMGK
jgi:hypothetical protein